MVMPWTPLVLAALFIAVPIAVASLALAWRGRWWGSSSACRRSSTSGLRS